MTSFDLSKSLQELDGEDWGEPDYPSHLVTECHRLRRVPLKDFRPGDLRIMIGQRICMEFLMPLALEHLRRNPITEGDLYPGDLLSAVFRAGSPFWRQYPGLRDEVSAIATEVASGISNDHDLQSAFIQFQKDQSKMD
jgi:hypothetical protein